MYSKTKSLVLHSIKHKDSTKIIYLLNADGAQITIFGGGFGKKKSDKSAVFYPGNIINGEFLTTKKSDLAKLKDPSINKHFSNIHTSFVKTALLTFVLEVLHKQVKPQESNYNVFPFVEQLLQLLDKQEKQFANLSVLFMIEMLNYHGIKPEVGTGWFNFKLGRFEQKSFPSDAFTEKSSKLLAQFLQQNMSENLALPMSNDNRKTLINELLRFIQYHTDNHKEILSLDIMSSIIS